jgi:hypothetical protein
VALGWDINTTAGTWNLLLAAANKAQWQLLAWLLGGCLVAWCHVPAAPPPPPNTTVCTKVNEQMPFWLVRTHLQHLI